VFGAGEGAVEFVDRHGFGLVVTKWGHIGHTLSDYDPGMVGRLLDNLDRVRAVLEEQTELDVYVTGGTLLGPYRDGRVMPHDDDADLAYLSRHAHVADVDREAFALGRLLVRNGLTVVRCSAGHLQLHFEHEGRPDGYVDIFTGWIDDAGWWNQLFPIRVQARRDQLLPVGSIDVDGHPEPVCREPETMLEAIYGPGWAVPDPSFRFEVPQSTRDRFWGWIGDQHMDRALWEDHYRYDRAGHLVELGTAPSEYVRWLAERLPAGAPVVELGHGRGHDALWLAAQGHPVEAVDYVRWPTARANEVAALRSLPARFRTLNLYDLRRVLAFGAEMAARSEPLTVYARDLLGVFWDVGRPTLFRLLAMLLRGGGQAHLDLPARSLMPEPGNHVPLHRTFDIATLEADLTPLGLRVDELHEVEEELINVPWLGAPSRFPKQRMVVSWQRRTR
jgi:hypothetical protein